MSERATTAIVLAAGLGQRMRPLTELLPKPLVALHGRPMIDHILDRLASAGVTRAVVNVHYRADQLTDHLAARRGLPEVTVSDERDALLDTGGGVTRALPLFGRKPFLIHNSDTVWTEGQDNNLLRLIEAFDPVRMDSLMLLAPVTGSLGYSGSGDFDMDETGLLRRRRLQEPVPFAFTGVSIAHPRLFDGAPQGAFSLNLLWDRAIDSGRLFGLPLKGMWMHVGTPEAWADAEQVMRAQADA